MTVENFEPIKWIDYSKKMPDLSFTYQADFYPADEDLPDPQIDPILPGARVPLRKVGIAPVDLPVIVPRRDGTEQVLQAQASLYCSLDDPDAKGLNLSRLYLIMHDTVAEHLSIEGIRSALTALAKKQYSKSAYCKLRFKYPWTQEALRSVDNNRIYTKEDGVVAYQKMVGHIAYDVELEGQYHQTITGPQYKFFLTVNYIYSSTCPCSFELAYDARKKRGVAANAHSQRSIAKVKIQFDPENVIWIEDLVELCRKNIPTEVQVVVKRRDEQAFAELNGSNLLFSEDACRILYQALDQWFENGRISDFSVAIEHIESLHNWKAIAVTSKFDPQLVPGCLT